MRWGIKRQLLIAIAVLAIVLLLGSGIWLAFFYRAPSCSDGLQNQGEQGIDCGGPCSLLCQAPLVSALWARSVEVAPGVYHAVAMVSNPESNAGTTALPYVFQLFDNQNILIAERRGTTFLQPGDVIPLFEPNIVTGQRVPVRTFVTFGNAVWTAMTRSESPIQVTSRTLDQSGLRLSAHIVNASARPVSGVALTALLYDTTDILVAASQTSLTSMPARGESDVVFTWQEPFARPVVRTEIVPRFETLQ